MPKAKGPSSSLIYSCELCNFRVTNHYIFKRHLHRCYTLHGIASQQSSPHHPMKMEETEGVDGICANTEKCEDPEGDSLLVNSGQGSVVELVDDGESDNTIVDVNQEDNVSNSPLSSQWSVRDSPQVMANGIEEGDNEDSKMDMPMEMDSDSIPPNMDQQMDAAESPGLMKAKFERQYNCEQCSYCTFKAKEYLHHIRDAHGEKLNVFECNMCDYASRYNNKLLRHMAIHNKGERIEDEVLEQNMEGAISEESLQSQELKVKPLKLKRLHVKAPSIFQVTHESRVKKDSQESPPIGKEVFKMVLSADGSHHYQCRGCLYYANNSKAVKKHHQLCHNKLLQCAHCQFNTTSQAEHYEHMMIHEGIGKQLIKCADCSYVTSARSNYDHHRSFHGCDLPSKCRVCNFAADSESKVKRHMATQHTNQHANPEPEIFPEDIAYQENAPWMEETLNESSLYEENAASHMIGLMDGGLTKTKKMMIMKYKCPQCVVVCLRRANLTRHLVARHNYSQKSASLCSKNIEKQMLRKRKLSSASSSLVSATKFKRPVASVGDQDVLKCSECSYAAKWPSDLRRHQQVHTMVKRFKCAMCTNKYKYLGDLNVHMRRDHLTEPQHTEAENVICSEVVKKSSPAVFRCPICAFSAQTKADLEQHTRQHGDIEKTFQCRLCDYQTYWRGDVGRHLFRHHDIHLSKQGNELEMHFIVRPEIRPLTKMPISFYSSMLGSEDVKSQFNSEDDGPTATPKVFPGMLGLKKTGMNPSGKEGQLSCSYPTCDYRTTTPDRLESHLAYHENLKKFMCPTCGKRSNWRWDVVKHMVKVHAISSAKADDVLTLSIEEARETIGDYLLKLDKKSSKIIAYGCSICQFKSGDRTRILQHLEESHKDEDGHVMSFSPGGRKNSSNAEGGGTLTDKFVEPPQSELAKHDRPYACSICQKTELTLADVKKHYSYAHPYKEIRVVYTVDGTEFNHDTLEIYSQKLAQPLDSEDNISPSAGQSGKMFRPDSKFSNPKMHGYIKPFKCSVCGLRSNWKWDLKKHLRAKHPFDGGFVIMLSIEEAQMTYGKECSRSHPKCEGHIALQQSPFSVKKEPEESPISYETTPPRARSSNSFGTDYDPSRRQWKCSGCDYITNWRRNMARHMHRHHPEDKSQLRVVALHLLSKDQQDDIYEERKQKLELLGKSTVEDEEEEENEFDDSFASISRHGMSKTVSKLPFGAEDKIWDCPQCPFQSILKTHIIVHMQKHGMKPFVCGVCNIPFMNRGPLHRHLQKVHQRLDYIKLVKVNIRYDGNSFSQPGIAQDFICSLCDMRFSDRNSAVEHLKDIHEGEANEDYIVPVTSTLASSFNPMNSKTFPVGVDSRVRNRKLHHCWLCPFQTQKKTMLTFHMTYHKPTAINRYKCKYCPYYVSTTRLLHQHQRKWHSDGRRNDTMTMAVWEHQQQTTPPQSPYKNGGSGTPRRHSCEKCPYTTNSKNDFFYHKQFHRPKRSAEYKCELCDYWVVHKRLLKQHMRLHKKQANLLQDPSPAKSVYSDPGLVYDPVELTELAALKQKMISAKILPSLSKSPKVSPMKLASRCGVDDKPGYVMRNGLYRKLHKCPKCPYTNIRTRNMQLHLMMHGPRESSYPLMRCPYCDYYVGSKGLLSHHMKVHQKNYGDTPEKDALIASNGMLEDDADESDDVDVHSHQKVDTLLQISRMKRFGCEKCPYASAKRQHFERHLELHGSRQRYTCQYCDYSVPSSYLLTQHSRLHLMPNQNLLSSQSINNLQHLSEVPADVALASALPPSDSDMSVTISVIHDHLGLYENSIYDPEQRKLYRCDRCPYANVRRDHLLSHLKFHMVSSMLVCPYCDYSAPKQALLTQHIRVHFCPLPELSNWLLENGQTERETNQRNIDLAEALKLAQEYQYQSKKKSDASSAKGCADEKENVLDPNPSDTLVCQYCDREFVSSEKLVKHELQHLIGNQFETAFKVLNKETSDIKTTEVTQKDEVHMMEVSELENLEMGPKKCVVNSMNEGNDDGDVKNEILGEHVCGVLGEDKMETAVKMENTTDDEKLLNDDSIGGEKEEKIKADGDVDMGDIYGVEEKLKTEGGMESEFKKMEGDVEEVLKVEEEFEGEFKKMEEEFEGEFKKMEGEIEGGFKKMEGEIEGGFKKMEGEIEGGFKKMEGEIEGRFKETEEKVEELKQMGGEVEEFKKTEGEVEGEFQKAEGDVEGELKKTEGGDEFTKTLVEDECKKTVGEVEEEFKKMEGEVEGELKAERGSGEAPYDKETVEGMMDESGANFNLEHKDGWAGDNNLRSTCENVSMSSNGDKLLDKLDGNTSEQNEKCQNENGDEKDKTKSKGHLQSSEIMDVDLSELI